MPQKVRSRIAWGEYRLREMRGESEPSVYRGIQSDMLYKPEMEKYIDAYVDLVQSVMLEFHARPYMTIERRLDMTRWVPEGYGTGDCVLIGDRTLHIIALKYGKGVPVSADGNPQLRLYALGALAA